MSNVIVMAFVVALVGLVSIGVTKSRYATATVVRLLNDHLDETLHIGVAGAGKTGVIFAVTGMVTKVDGKYVNIEFTDISAENLDELPALFDLLFPYARENVAVVPVPQIRWIEVNHQKVTF